MSAAPQDAVMNGAAALSGSPFGRAVSAAADGSGGVRALTGVGVPTDLSASILPLLEALGWQGHPQQVAEALPHFVDSIDITSFRNVLATLGYASRAERASMDEIAPDEMPCLFLPDDSDALILVSAENGGVEVFQSSDGRFVRIADSGQRGTACFFSPVAAGAVAAGAAAGDWFLTVGDRFRALGYEVLAMTFAINLLALATPLFVMAAYDKAIAEGSAVILAYLAAGVAIALVSDVALKSARARAFSFLGARLDNIVGVEVVRKILALPTALIERAAIGAQVARIRDFETVREFFTGPAAPVLFELPFVLVLVAVIAYLGGTLAFLPIFVLALAGALGLAVMPRIGDAAARASEAAVEKQEMTVETLAGMRAIKVLGAEDAWLGRYRHVSARAALRNFHAAQFSSLLETFSYLVMMGSGFATVVFGVERVQTGDMTYGALAACMILVWRALLPLRTGLVSLAQVNQIEVSAERLNDLMEMPSDGAHATVPPQSEVRGQVTFVDVTLRYEADTPLALDGVNFDIKGGLIVAVLGGNGAGKSSMLKLLAGVYETEVGSVMIDGRDVRDMSATERRQLVSYVPQTPQFFYGTVAQNLRLAHPTASDEELRWAARQAGALDDIERLEQGSGEWKRTGFDVRLGDRGSGQLSPGLLQRVSLARGYLKRAPIVLLDEPGNGLDIAGDQSLMRALANMRGERTVFIVTHRPSHLKMADRIIWLEQGRIRTVGRSKVVMQSTKGAVI